MGLGRMRAGRELGEAEDWATAASSTAVVGRLGVVLNGCVWDRNLPQSRRLGYWQSRRHRATRILDTILAVAGLAATRIFAVVATQMQAATAGGGRRPALDTTRHSRQEAAGGMCSSRGY